MNHALLVPPPPSLRSRSALEEKCETTRQVAVSSIRPTSDYPQIREHLHYLGEALKNLDSEGYEEILNILKDAIVPPHESHLVHSRTVIRSSIHPISLRSRLVLLKQDNNNAGMMEVINRMRNLIDGLNNSPHTEMSDRDIACDMIRFFQIAYPYGRKISRQIHQTHTIRISDVVVIIISTGKDGNTTVDVREKLQDRKKSAQYQYHLVDGEYVTVGRPIEQSELFRHKFTTPIWESMHITLNRKRVAPGAVMIHRNGEEVIIYDRGNIPSIKVESKEPMPDINELVASGEIQKLVLEAAKTALALPLTTPPSPHPQAPSPRQP